MNLFRALCVPRTRTVYYIVVVHRRLLTLVCVSAVAIRAQVKQMGERIKGDLLDHVTRTVYGKRIRQKLQVR
eukprot:COSAG02_NODE_31621_length_530_cov_1.090487_1_plen_72_part_00